jgi:predicted NBD/HSP70 family sugar kinase
MREINSSIVLGLIREHGQISRAEIARQAHLSAATVTGITTSLIAQGLVYEDTPGASTGGRRPILLSFNRRAGIALGVKITERQLVCVVTDLGGAEHDQTAISLPGSVTPEHVVTLIAGEVARLRHVFPRQRLVGVGIGIAGVVDRPSGVCRLSPFLRWRNVPLRAALEEAIAVPVVVENDVNTLTYAFQMDAEASDSGSFVVVTLGRGVGLGMTINGLPFRGSRGQGGEFGHITMDAHGPQCECGKRGCLEATVALPALLAEARQAVGNALSEQEYRGYVMSGDARIAPSIDRAASVLGEGLAILVNVLNPDMLVLSGEGAWLMTHMLPKLTATMQANVFDGLADELQVRVEVRGDAYWAKGAAGVLIEETFKPQLERSQRPERKMAQV